MYKHARYLQSMECEKFISFSMPCTGFWKSAVSISRISFFNVKAKYHTQTKSQRDGFSLHAFLVVVVVIFLLHILKLMERTTADFGLYITFR